LALLLRFSDNYLEQAQFNTELYNTKEMDWVGFEPTTSAQPAFSGCANASKKVELLK
jgi:hypothetical protein